MRFIFRGCEILTVSFSFPISFLLVGFRAVSLQPAYRCIIRAGQKPFLDQLSRLTSLPGIFLLRTRELRDPNLLRKRFKSIYGSIYPQSFGLTFPHQFKSNLGLSRRDWDYSRYYIAVHFGLLIQRVNKLTTRFLVYNANR